MTLTTLLVYQRYTPCHFFVNQPIRWKFGNSFGKSTSHWIPLCWGLVQYGGIVKSNLGLFPVKRVKNIKLQICKHSFQGRTRKVRVCKLFIHPVTCNYYNHAQGDGFFVIDTGILRKRNASSPDGREPKVFWLPVQMFYHWTTLTGDSWQLRPLLQVHVWNIQHTEMVDFILHYK